MKRNTSIPSVIAKFREQRQRMKKLLIAFAILVIVGVMAPLFLSTLPALQNNPP